MSFLFCVDPDTSQPSPVHLMSAFSSLALEQESKAADHLYEEQRGEFVPEDLLGAGPCFARVSEEPPNGWIGQKRGRLS